MRAVKKPLIFGLCGLLLVFFGGCEKSGGSNGNTNVSPLPALQGVAPGVKSGSAGAPPVSVSVPAPPPVPAVPAVPAPAAPSGPVGNTGSSVAPVAGTGHGGGSLSAIQGPPAVPYRDVASGFLGGSFFSAAHTLHISDDASWQALWAQHSSYLATAFPPSAPAVDFSSEFLVGRFLGPQAQGSSVRVIETAIDLASGQVLVRTDERPAAGSAPLFSNPFVIVAVQHSPVGLPGVTVEPVEHRGMIDVATGFASQYRYGDQTFQGEIQAIHDSASWDALWNQHDPLQAAPVVDFNQHSLLAGFHGWAGSAGYGFALRAAWYNPLRDELVVHSQHANPQGAVGALVTNPFHFVKVPAVPSTASVREIIFETVTPTVLAEDNDSQYSFQPGFSGARLVFRDSASFASFWAQHAPGSNPPSVDFSQSLVVAAFLGYQTHLGGLIDILWAATAPPTGGYEIQPIVALPGSQPGTAATPNNPFIIVTLPRRPGPVFFY